MFRDFTEQEQYELDKKNAAEEQAAKARSLITQRAQANQAQHNAGARRHGLGNFAGAPAFAGMHPIAHQQAQAAAGMVGQLNSAFAKENDRRVEQSRDEQERAHELQIKQMEAQQRQAELNQEKAMADEAQRRKDQRNAMLMSMAGVPMKRQTTTNGRGGVNIFRNALLG
jgi:hypothetical protein